MGGRYVFREKSGREMILPYRIFYAALSRSASSSDVSIVENSVFVVFPKIPGPVRADRIEVNGVEIF